MADGIRGKDYENFPPDVQKGIMLHRAIDTFTDAHPIFRQGTKRLHERYHHYAGVIMDVFYDHFLAKNFKNYSDRPLEDFANDFYESLENNYDWLSEKAQHMLPIMRKYNWLVMYSTVNGISQILTQMDSRSGNKSGMKHSEAELLEFYDEFEAEFTAFFEEIRTFASEKLALL